jgi:replicative DNA helicase
MSIHATETGLMLEAYLLGAAMQDPDFIAEYGGVIRADMFQAKLHQKLWHALSTLAAKNEPTDLVSLSAAYGDLVKEIGAERLVNYTQTYISRGENQRRVEKFLELHIRRMVMEGAKQIAELASDTAGTSLDELRSAIEQVALAASESGVGGGLSAGPDEAVEWLRTIESRFKDPSLAYGMQTGWDDLDMITLGWQRGDLIVVGGRTSVGKTAFSIENLIRVHNAGYKVAMFSLEMSKEQVRNRIASNIADVRLASIRTGRMSKEDMVRVAEVMHTISKIPIDDTRGVTAEYITAEMKRYKRMYGLDFVIVDYIQEIYEPPQPNDNTGSAYGRVARKLRKAAQICDCAVMALSQLNRDADIGEPKLKHLSGSSGIESAADVVILLHRDKENQPDVLKVNVAKQRNGPVGEVNMQYDLSRQRIQSINDRRYGT